MKGLIAIVQGLGVRSRVALVVLLAAALVAPLVLDRYLVSVLILVLYFAFVGQAWNVMMGFAGQLSLGHALYVGLGAYTAGALYQNLDVNPWLGMLAAVAVCVIVACAVGWLAFRFGISGTYFSLLTIAFAEFTRIAFDHVDWVGGSGGLFLKVGDPGVVNIAQLRGPPILFYYVVLALAVAALVLCAWLLKSRIGYFFRAVRDNEDAARAAGIDVFRTKMIAIALSAALTGVAGVFFAFYNNNLFPEQTFGMGRSIEIILAPIIGGVGTLFGPVLGAAILTGASEGLNQVLQSLGWEAPGVKQVLYGTALGLVIMFLPGGVWPALARRFGVGRGR